MQLSILYIYNTYILVKKKERKTKGKKGEENERKKEEKINSKLKLIIQKV